MIFILHSGINQDSIGTTLGKPEYSYFFVLDGFRKSLEKLGRVITVQNPETEVDKIFAEEENCIFLSFAPPNHAPVGLKCPTLTVFAWEFSNIPYETWDDDPRNDWRYVLAHHGKAITLSTYSSRAVSDAMGENFPVASIPVPVWDDFEGARRILEPPIPMKERILRFEGSLLDSHNYNLEPVENISQLATTPAWDEQDLSLSFDFSSPDITRLSGFYAPEDWGAWSRGNIPRVELPVALSGIVGVTLKAHAFRSSANRDITVTLGSSKTTVRLTEVPCEYYFEFVLIEPATQLSFKGLVTTPPPGSEDKRTLGIGLSSICIAKIGQTGQEPTKASVLETETRKPEVTRDQTRLKLSGIVYTSVFNPADGRKNWIDIVTAFCYAHRDHDNATLVLKMVTNDPNSYMGTLHLLLPQLAPFKCRVIAIRAFLPQAEYQALICSTSYYVNASHCEGLCLPLMEFLSAGVPAIAPDHTAMADYINDNLAFKVKSSVEQNVWPGDPRDLFRTLRYRINWESLRDAYIDSYRVAMSDPQQYQSMSYAAREQLRVAASIDTVSEKITEFLGS